MKSDEDDDSQAESANCKYFGDSPRGGFSDALPTHTDQQNASKIVESHFSDTRSVQRLDDAELRAEISNVQLQLVNAVQKKRSSGSEYDGGDDANREEKDRLMRRLVDLKFRLMQRQEKTASPTAHSPTNQTAPGHHTAAELPANKSSVITGSTRPLQLLGHRLFPAELAGTASAFFPFLGGGGGGGGGSGAHQTTDSRLAAPASPATHATLLLCDCCATSCTPSVLAALTSRQPHFVCEACHMAVHPRASCLYNMTRHCPASRFYAAASHHHTAAAPVITHSSSSSSYTTSSAQHLASPLEDDQQEQLNISRIGSLGSSLSRQKFACPECSCRLTPPDSTTTSSSMTGAATAPWQLPADRSGASGGASVPSAPVSECAARLCHYSGLFFCANCHWGGATCALIPAVYFRLGVWHELPVSRSNYLRLNFYWSAAIFRAPSNWLLGNAEARNALQLRRRLSRTRRYTNACDSLAQLFRTQIAPDQPDWLFDQPYNFSMKLVKQLCDGQLIHTLQTILFQVAAHCQDCVQCVRASHKCFVCCSADQTASQSAMMTMTSMQPSDLTRRQRPLFHFSNQVQTCAGKCHRLCHRACNPNVNEHEQTVGVVDSGRAGEQELTDYFQSRVMFCADCLATPRAGGELEDQTHAKPCSSPL